MTPDILFQWANTVALLGWVLLIIGLFLPVLWTTRAGLIIPVLLSILYVAVALTHFAASEGGFDTLANVMSLFQQPEMVLAGWTHYLAFDLFVGWWIARDCRTLGISRLLVIPCLLLTFMLGPTGFLLYLIIRSANLLTTHRQQGHKPKASLQPEAVR